MLEVRNTAADALDFARRLGQQHGPEASIDLSLDVLTEQCRAEAAIFAVAGSRQAGARFHPRDLPWARVFADDVSRYWETGPFTGFVRRYGLGPPMAIGNVLRDSGMDSLPFTLPLAAGGCVEFVAYVPVFASRSLIAGYFLARARRDFTDAELSRAALLQGILITAHQRFLLPPDPPALPPRQGEILALIQQGLTCRAIGTRLGISVSTVEKHTAELYRRLNTSDRVSALAEARRLGLLAADPPWRDAVMGPL